MKMYEQGLKLNCLKDRQRRGILSSTTKWKLIRRHFGIHKDMGYDCMIIEVSQPQDVVNVESPIRQHTTLRSQNTKRGLPKSKRLRAMKLSF